MTVNLRFTTAALLGALALAPALRAEPDKPAPREEKKGLRVLTPERRVIVQSDKRPLEKETVTFLGVETSPVTGAMTAQLGLSPGTGLVVNQVIPKSPAADVLKVHDILLKLDDQILIEVRQLSVLVRNHRPGDEITVTYVRGGQTSTAKVKLGQHEVPKFMSMLDGGLGPIPFSVEKGEFRVPEERADVDRVLSMIQRAHNGEPVRIQIDREGAPGFRAMTIHANNSNVVFSDDDGSLELTMKDGAKTLVAKNAKGEQVFSGPVNSPEERKAMPADVRDRLEKLEAMHHMSFKTDGDFQGAERHVLRPHGISLPMPAQSRPAQRTLFF